MPGIWFRPNLGTAATVLPLKTRLWATRESVTGGIALKILLEPGSTGIIAMEHSPFPAGSAGITFHAKASQPVVAVVNGVERSVGTSWTKVDYDWASLGSSSSSPDVGWQFVLAIKGPITTRTYVIIDRLGIESPTFDAAPSLSPLAGPDTLFDGDTMFYGAANLAPTIARLNAKQAIKVIGFGDSVTAGVQAYRSTWAMDVAACAPYLYFSHLARLLNARFAYTGVTWQQFGHGGWTADQARGIVDAEVVANATAGDLVFIEFGGNDLAAGRTIAQLKADLKALIDRVQTKTSQIIVMPATLSSVTIGYAAALNTMIQQIVAEEGVAGIDLLAFMASRGAAFGWAMEANEAHPDLMGHITIAEMIAPILTGQHMVYPSDGAPVPSGTTSGTTGTATGTTGTTGTSSTSGSSTTGSTGSAASTGTASTGSSSSGSASTSGSPIDSGGTGSSTCGLGGGLALVLGTLVLCLRRHRD